MAVGPGNKTTITFGTSVFAAVITAVNGVSLSRGSIASSSMATTADMTFLPDDLSDSGEVTYSGHHSGALDPPITGGTAPETIVIDWAGDGISNKWGFSGFMTGYSPGAPMGDMMTFDCTVKLTGALAVT